MKNRLIALLLLTAVIFSLYTTETWGTDLKGLSPVPAMAVVIVYREKKLKASAAKYKIYLNDVPLAVLTNGTWTGVVVEPGSYDLWIELSNPRHLISRAVSAFQWDGDRVYFVKTDSHFISNGLTWRASAELIDEQTALKDIRGLREAESLIIPAGKGKGGNSGFFFIDRLPSFGK